MTINKNTKQVYTYYNYSSASHAEIIARKQVALNHMKEVAASILKLGGQLALNDATIDMFCDGFSVRIAGHKGDIAWHENTNYKYETYKTIVDDDDVTRHETVDDAVTALLRTPA